MLNKQDLIDWCWLNLEFDNDPETWEDTYIIDILSGYNGYCYINGKRLSYGRIRMMFTDYDEE